MNRRSSSGLDLGEGSILANGKYRICDLVGAGAMGQVYRAVHTALGRAVAIKVFLPDESADEYGEARFLREARAASKLQHPASMQVLDFGAENGVFYIVMEYLDGPNMARLIEEEAPLETERIARLMIQVLAALAAAHDHGVIHRDLKPENIILLRQYNDDGAPVESLKVCDFGIAKIQSTAGQESLNTLTQDGMVMGTPSYMSPEQCRGLEIDPRSDIYSCGVMLYEMATGRLPFEADNPIGLMMQHITDLPPDPREFHGNIHPSLVQIILKCIMKSPEDRYANARELREELKKLTSHSSATQISLFSSPVLETATDLPPSTEENERADLEPANEIETQGAPVPPEEELSVGQFDAASQQPEPLSDEGEGEAVPAAPPIVRGVPTSDPPEQRGNKKVFPVVIIAVSMTLLLATGGIYWMLEESPSNEVRMSVPLQGNAALDDPNHVSSVKVSPIEEAANPPTEETSIENGAGDTPSKGQKSAETPDIARPSKPPARSRIKPEPSKRNAVADNEFDSPDEEEEETTTPSAPEETEDNTKALPPDDTGKPSMESPSGSVETPVHVPIPPPKVPPVKPPEKKVVLKPATPALEASVGLKDLTVHGSLPITPVKTGIKRLNHEWEACYQQAARSAGRDARISLQVELMIDEDGRARRPAVSNASLPNLSRCISKTATKIRSRTRPDTGTVQVAFKLVFIPKPPTR